MLRVLQACQHRVGYVRSVACLLTHSATCFLDFICLTPGSLRSSPAPMTRLPTQHPPTTYHELSVAAPALARAHASTNPRQRCRNPHPYHTPQQEQESDWPHCMLLLSLSLSSVVRACGCGAESCPHCHPILQKGGKAVSDDTAAPLSRSMVSVSSPEKVADMRE